MIRYNIEDINSLDFDLQKMFAMKQVWQNGRSFQMKLPRNNSAFLHVEKGTINYTFEDREDYVVFEGETVYLPKGSVYESTFDNADDGQPVTLLCEFEAVDSNGEPFTLYDNVTAFKLKGVMDNFNDMIKACLAPTPCVARQKSLVFGIIYELLRHERAQSLKASKDFSSIAKGIMYLENDPLQEKSIAEIAEMCNVCVSGFRRLFKEYSGMSPNEYRINEKINRAKKMLLMGNMTVQEIARALGFEDSGYFCKLFKEKTGVSPGKYGKT